MNLDYFKLLDTVTIAWSRKHIEKYYNLDEIGKFPTRLSPQNIYPVIDTKGKFPPIETINKLIKKLSLCVYSPLGYVLPEKRRSYELKYDMQVGQSSNSVFRQVDREQSLVGLLRIGLLKRMESSINFFALTIEAIILSGTFTELPPTLLSEDKFGLYLRRNDVQLIQNVDDEPKDGSPICLTIRLTINASLEPKWEVVCNRKEPKPISHNERKAMFIGSVGENCGKDMVWGRSSVLQKYADAKGVLHDAYTAELREIAAESVFSNPSIFSVLS